MYIIPELLLIMVSSDVIADMSSCGFDKSKIPGILMKHDGVKCNHNGAEIGPLTFKDDIYDLMCV